MKTILMVLMLIATVCLSGCFGMNGDDTQAYFARLLGEAKVEVKEFGISVKQQFQKYTSEGIAIAIKVKGTEDIVFQKTFDHYTTFSTGEIVELIPFFITNDLKYQISVIVGDQHSEWQDIK